jgi:nucleoside-diphosphate-sugar epimerase
MVATNDRMVTVFGGTGFLGRRIVRHLRVTDFLFASRQGIQIGGTDASKRTECSSLTSSTNSRSPAGIASLG